MNRLKVAFVCVHNSCRSQMAEAIANHLGSDVFDVYSAGTENYHEVKPLAVEVVEELGIKISDNYPKLLSDIPSDINIVITMGCNVECPYIPGSYTEDWGLEDPSGKPIEEFRITRDIIHKKVEELIKRVQAGEFQ